MSTSSGASTSGGGGGGTKLKSSTKASRRATDMPFQAYNGGAAPF